MDEHVPLWIEVDRRSYPDPESRDFTVLTLVRDRCAGCGEYWIHASPYEAGTLAAASERLNKACGAFGGAFEDAIRSLKILTPFLWMCRRLRAII